MTDFLFLYRANPEQRRAAMGTPEQAQQSMQAWLAWMRDLESKGHIRNPGQPLDAGGSTVKGKARLVTDGPFVEAKDIVLGYTLIQARDIAEAAELAKGCPILEGDGSVEVRPVMSM